jgi:hypothetical protein
MKWYRTWRGFVVTPRLTLWTQQPVAKDPRGDALRILLGIERGEKMSIE